MATITNLNLDYLLDEIDHVIVAREHDDLPSYLAENRAGRGLRLTANLRRAIWRLHEQRETLTRKTNKITWSQFRRRAVKVVRAGGGPRPFDGVLIDEAQDLEPTAIRLLTSLCKTTDRLFLTADPNQSIYGSSIRWADVHEDLKFRGRTGFLRRNYRSTRQIIGAAESYLAGAELESAEAPTDCARFGQLPEVRRVDSRGAEVAAIVRFVQDETRALRTGLGGCAVLVPTHQAGMDLAKSISSRGQPARFMARKAIDLASSEIKVIPMKSAKGLEFPIVVVAGIGVNFPGTTPVDATTDQADDMQQLGRRSLYVAMTRAMHALLVVVPAGNPTLTVEVFDPECWNLETEAASPVIAADLAPRS